MILCGHTHYWQIANDGRNVAVATRSIGDPEGGPPGYLIAYFHGDDLAFAYRSVEDRGPIAMIIHPREAILAAGPRHIVRGPAQIRVHTWSDATVTPVRGPVDDQPWITLEVDERVGYAGRPRCMATGCARASTRWQSRSATRTIAGASARSGSWLTPPGDTRLSQGSSPWSSGRRSVEARPTE